jgi:hypothetical protein
VTKRRSIDNANRAARPYRMLCLGSCRLRGLIRCYKATIGGGETCRQLNIKRAHVAVFNHDELVELRDGV